MKNHSRYWLASVWCQLFPLYTTISGYEDTNVFHFPRLPFLSVYNPRVATISFDQKREGGFDEQLAHILKFKQTYWAPLVGEMWAITTMYSHRQLYCNWICTMALWWEKEGKLGKRQTSFTSYFPLYSLYFRKQPQFLLYRFKQELNTTTTHQPIPSLLYPPLLLFSGDPCLNRTLFNVVSIKMILAKEIPHESSSF